MKNAFSSNRCFQVATTKGLLAKKAPHLPITIVDALLEIIASREMRHPEGNDWPKYRSKCFGAVNREKRQENG